LKAIARVGAMVAMEMPTASSNPRFLCRSAMAVVLIGVLRD
jgi:hypothetical protein